MITKMNKYAYLVYHKEYDAFLKQLRNMGVVHISSKKPTADHPVITELVAESKRMQTQIDYLENILKEYNATHNENQIATSPIKKISRREGGQLLGKIETLRDELTKSNSAIATYTKERDSLDIWGDFDYDNLERLREAGYEVTFFTCPTSRYDESWETNYNAIKINESKSICRFITVTHTGSTISIDADRAKLPIKDASHLTDDIVEEETNKENIENSLLDIARNNLDSLRLLKFDVEDDTNWNKVLIQTDREANDKLMLLEGWIPEDKKTEMETTLSNKGYYYQQLEITKDDDVPIKLKNNRFAKMFEVLTGMYGMPEYEEFDPTIILAPFYLLFFAFCMGDGGYGIILILFGLGVTYGKIKIDMFKGLGPLITTLGVGTLIVGLFLGTAFGVDLTTLSFVPESLKKMLLKGSVAGYDIQMVAAIAIGVFHIALAMVVKAICYTKRYGFKNNIATWGWLLLILGGIITGILALCKVLSPNQTKWVFIGIGIISALGIYIFNTPGRNPLLNIGSGLWDTYNMATGLLGDVLSYIRLYALGLAGGMLGAAFNMLAGMVLADEKPLFSWIPFVIILIFGHVLNILMSCLGAFVHPLRLTFVEYFKNSGYVGKGLKYNPFAVKQQI